jgi:uncharacterized damage-inducible protein DinB
MGEIAFYLLRLDDLRQKLRDALLGLSADGLNWKPLAEGSNSVYNLARHSAWVEQYWIGFVLGQRPAGRVWEGDEDLEGQGEDAADLLFWLDEAATISRDVLGALRDEQLDDLRTRTHDDGRQEQLSGRWIVVHTIEHYAEHLGQMHLTRQLWEAQVKG